MVGHRTAVRLVRVTFVVKNEYRAAAFMHTLIQGAPVQDNDGDWMLLGPEQPWPGKLDHVACRIVVSSA